ncbi:tRNA (N(6)-L-threonylcarbamoyladenosine(37)-C(2))-methylthiotransferase MtaB [Acidobacteriota bacterium]
MTSNGSSQGDTPDHGRTYAISSFGCKANRYDAAVIEEQLAALGYEPAESTSTADLIVVNTCTVTARADADARHAIARIRRRNPDCRLVITGCLAQRDPGLLRELNGRATILGNDEKFLLADVMTRIPDGQPAVQDLPGAEPSWPSALPPSAVRFSGMTRGYLKIQDGCPGGCTFCIVPSVRGPSRWLAKSEVLNRIESLLDAGFKEIVLTGIHVGLYGDKGGLLDLLKKIERIPRTFRIRLSSIECMELDDDLIRFIAGSEKIARHLHIPLQSGSSKILQDMGRHYRPSRYADCVELAARLIPDVGIGADVMVGFPTEREAEFEETKRLISGSPLTYLHVFRFSPRPGTPAGGMKKRTPDRTVSQWSAELKALGAVKNLTFRERFAGCRVPGLTLETDTPTALTTNYIKVHLEKTSDTNRLVPITLTRINPDKTWGKVEERDEPGNLP